MTRKERNEVVGEVLDRLTRDKALLSDGAVTVRTAVEVYGIGRTDLFKRIKAGELPAIKLGKKTLIPRAALIALLGKHMIPVGRPVAVGV
jgi:excisionase family DNA binding protein